MNRVNEEQARVFVIAEAGVNHNGDVNLAFKIVDAAKEIGADAVKFQTFRADLEVRKGTPLVAYQAQGAEFSDMFDMVKALELSADDFIALRKYCDKRGIRFMSTAFDLPSLALLVETIGVDILKIPSGEADNTLLLRAFGRAALPTILSTGMCNLSEITFAIATLRECWDRLSIAPRLTLLHCTTAYPTPANEVHLRSMLTIADHFKLPVGFSDHSSGIHASVAAVGMGATVIEKHLTLDRGMSGPDHAASLDPSQMGEMIRAIRDVEAMMGSPIKELRTIERETISLVRRSLFAARDITAGALLDETMIVAMRPQCGIPASAVDQVINRRLIRSCRAGDVLQWNMIEA